MFNSSFGDTESKEKVLNNNHNAIVSDRKFTFVFNDFNRRVCTTLILKYKL